MINSDVMTPDSTRLFVLLQVLFHSLPVMLERCVDYKLVGGGAEPIVIDQAVDFLQALLDLLTELHVHLEVCAKCFLNSLAAVHYDSVHF